MIDSRYAMWRLLVILATMTTGAAGMYVVPVVLPAVQADFGVARADAALPYTLLMIGYGLGGIWMGRLADRFGVMVPIFTGAVMLGLGFSLAAVSGGLWSFTAIHCLLIGVGSSSCYAPLLADTSLWFARRRGIAVAVCASGNYLGGALWPPIVQHVVEGGGWRQAYCMLAVVSLVVMALLALALRRPPPAQDGGAAGAKGAGPQSALPFGMQPRNAQILLCIAGIGCCTAMAMPQVHIVAYCSDLGYGAARGAQMLSLMLAAGIVSRLISGAISDRIGGLRTLILGSTLQTIALALFLPFDGMASLYLLSALFGLFQGGIVPSYAIIVREHFPVSQAGARVGAVIMATMLGMALGGWMSGKIFDLTFSYQAAFINGIAWNLLNLAIALWLLHKSGGLSWRPPRAVASQ